MISACSGKRRYLFRSGFACKREDTEGFNIGNDTFGARDGGLFLGSKAAEPVKGILVLGDGIATEMQMEREMKIKAAKNN